MAENKNDNLRYYNQLRTVPKEAIKTIQAGRLKGMSDVNPVWRIKAMTDAFGACGIGWKYAIVKQWQEQYGQEVKAFCNINLSIKVDGEWSEPIPGTGGATIVEVNSKGLYVNDEGFKMALTDALSVAMKSLGVAADIYFDKDTTKYTQPTQQTPVSTQQPAPTTNLFDNDLEEAFQIIRANIESAPSRQYLNDLHKQNPALHDYPAYKQAMNKRFKEVQ